MVLKHTHTNIYASCLTSNSQKIKIIENKLSNSKTPSAGQFNVIDNMESFISGAIVKNPPATQGCVCLTRSLRELSSIYVKITWKHRGCSFRWQCRRVVMSLKFLVVCFVRKVVWSKELPSQKKRLFYVVHVKLNAGVRIVLLLHWLKLSCEYLHNAGVKLVRPHLSLSGSLRKRSFKEANR